MTRDDVVNWAKRISDSKTMAALLGAIAGFVAAYLVLGRDGQPRSRGSILDTAAMLLLAWMAFWAISILGTTWPVVALVGMVSVVALAGISSR